MAICKALERDLDIVQAQYKEECLTSHVKELAAYVAKAQALLQAGRTAEQLAASVGDAAKARVRTGRTVGRARWELGCVVVADAEVSPPTMIVKILDSVACRSCCLLAAA